jgi:hypothetical protein
LVSLSVVAREVVPEPKEDNISKILAFIDTAARWLGGAIISILELIVKVTLPEDLVVPIGYLAMLTGVLLLFSFVEAAKRVVWFIVIIGWLLIIVRIIMELIRT